MLFRLLTLATLLALPLAAELRIASPFGDHMVLQRDQPVPVWGWADPGQTVTVTFAGQTRTTKTDATGAWRTTLAPLSTNATPRTFNVTATHPKSKTQSQKFTDVLVGEVWLCGGQSNMERQLGPRGGQKPLIGWEAEVATADRPLLRQLYVTQTRAPEPQATVDATWSVCTPATAPNFTAVGYYFGRDLQAALGANVPVGIIHSSWGGTPAEAWTSLEGLADFPEFSDAIAVLDASNETEAKRRYLEKTDAWLAAHDPGENADTPWSSTDAATTNWPTMELPALWEDRGHDGFDGLGWFTRSFDLPPNWSGRDLVLRLGRVDDVDTTWVNGQKLGTTTGYMTLRRYEIPAALLKPSGNVVTVRIIDTGGGGGIWDPATALDLAPSDGSAPAINLSGSWHYQLVADLQTTPRPPMDVSNSASSPIGLYNGMIAPLVPYAIRGVTFYQGEANAGRSTQYRTLLPALIADWRTQWSQPELPFLFVQIAPFEGQPPEIREAQLLAWQATENTAMIVTTDVGDATDIHPAHKEPVGARLALAARALAYDEDLVYSGPVYDSMSIDGHAAAVRFKHAANGLVAPGGELQGFTIAGEDGVFHPATAKIVGHTVVVTAATVPAPTAVRYAWTNVATGNLFNTAGLPASPFRTDHP
ncbi:sialate O-acetylesterase [Synoicihabitans lomoniglobus]|uniref:Sialate O-acetylesterase n=1 Tax=Synoicihabitans lomoniglobus TaxID=2909285 RepID=A0AAE9ZW45_9BACT|nr:hypothetical protein [Opitutaceae bacterium LMO-M01]WED64269.1 sialate O-acetylesterase [Opitutaceae bacterium LMO-M01]